MNTSIHDMIIAQKKGQAIGLFSVCAAHPVVIESSVKFATGEDIPVLIEATCNQVNQFGGYTGLVPGQFAKQVSELIAKYQLSRDRLVLGGDHLGPYPWRGDPSAIAMQKASQLVHDYVQAGFSKIHLDASMRCADDHPKLPMELIAERTARLCSIAEETANQIETGGMPVYVIGSEVPLPGGAENEEENISVTSVQDVSTTIEATKHAFKIHGLDQAWERVVAVVVQPGVEFGENHVLSYDRPSAKQLFEYIQKDQQLVFEAHSTDYQTPDLLKKLVEDQFAILKVGPELTFAYREAVFAMEMIVRELQDPDIHLNLSNLRNVLDEVMREKPEHWQAYYHGTEKEIAVARLYSYSDRIRYYWSDPRVQKAVDHLMNNLKEIQLPEPLLSQYLPEQYQKIRQGKLAISPMAIIEDKIQQILKKYARACGLF